IAGYLFSIVPSGLLFASFRSRIELSWFEWLRVGWRKQTERRGESQRDSGPKPRVARHEATLGKSDTWVRNPNGVVAELASTGHNPVGVEIFSGCKPRVARDSHPLG